MKLIANAGRGNGKSTTSLVEFVENELGLKLYELQKIILENAARVPTYEILFRAAHSSRKNESNSGDK